MSKDALSKRGASFFLSRWILRFARQVLLVAALLLHPAGATGASHDLPEAPFPDELLNLVFGDWGIGTGGWDEANVRWVAAIRSPERLGPLMDLFHWAHDEAKDPRWIEAILDALEARGDLPPDEIGRIVALMQAAVSQPADSRTEMQKKLMAHAGLLASYPSPEHERLQLEILRDSVRANQSPPALGLERSGTLQSFKEIRRLIEQQESMPLSYRNEAVLNDLIMMELSVESRLGVGGFRRSVSYFLPAWRWWLAAGAVGLGGGWWLRRRMGGSRGALSPA